MGLKEFLVAAKLSQNDLLSRPKIHIVIGNESCDLDSTVCTVTYAYYLHKLKLKPGTSILPVLCVQRDKFRLRLETVFFLRKHTILPDDLLFLDDLDLDALCRNEAVSLTATLVDHHVLSSAEACLNDRVVEVLDHRPLAGFLPSSWNAQIEPVGSCATLVARKILSSEDFTLDSTVAELLLGTILIDTGNLSASDNLATPLDHEVLVQLKSFLPPSISATSIYDEIHASKFDLSSLTVSEMLQKDLKVLKGKLYTVAMSTITMDIQDVLKRPEFSSDAADFCRMMPVDTIIIMAFVSGDAGILHRWIAVYSGDEAHQGQLADVLLGCTNPNLDLEPLTLTHERSNVIVFKQKNLQASRKKVLPVVQNFLAQEVTTPEENLNSSGQFVYIDPGERGDNCEEETRRHINLAKTFQSDQFRTSQDRYDLAAVGTEALISPSLSSESDLACLEGDNDGRDILLDVGQQLDLVLNNQGGCGDVLLSPQKQSNDPETVNNLIDLNEVAPSTGMDERFLGIDVPSHVDSAQEVHVLTLVSNGDIQHTSSNTTNISDSLFTEDILQNHTPFDLLCPTNVDSPLDISSMPTSGQVSGQGSKVPSYPDTPPNSFMESSGVVFFKETQLPSFNSSEMVRRIHAKKATLAGHTGVKNFRYDNNEEDEGYDGLCVGGPGENNSGGSLISPAVPQNSYMDLTSAYDQQIPELANSDILERVIEKRSQFEWNVESLDESGGVLGDFLPANHITIEPFTPQNSFIEGSFDTYVRNTLPSINNAESVAKIRAKQSAMFGGSGSSDESGGCQSPDIGGKSPRIPSPYTPQNSYRDSMLVLESRNMIPDLNEVAERLSVEHSSKPQYVGGAKEEEQCGTNHQNNVKPTRHSSSQSDSQNTMSDVESLMSVSTDIGTPSENIVATSLAGLMRSEMALLGRRDTNDSEVFGPVGKSEDNLTDGKKSDSFPKFNHVGSPPKVTFMSGRGESRKVGFEDKDLFSPVDEGQLRTVEDLAFYQAAESIVAQSVAAALQASKDRVGGAANDSEGGKLRWSDNTVNFIEDDGEVDQDLEDDRENNDDTENDDENIDIEAEEANEQGDSDEELPIDRTNSNTANFEEKKSCHLTQDTLQMSSHESPGPSIQEANAEYPTAAEQNGASDSLETVLMESALRELAYEFANDLIQSVLNDFPFNAEEREENRKGPSPKDKDKYIQLSRKSSSEKLKSMDMNMSSSSERKRSRDNDPAFTIVEGELTETFPERKQSSEVDVEDSKEMSKSFPYRKFSKSEDFPARRFSREENLSRRSSKLDDSEYDSSIKREDLETDYLPNMDPLQGNLDIIDASYSKITDTDREVVEEESFRKVSAEHLFKDNKDIESNNSGLNSEDSNLIDDEGELSEEAFKKMATKSRKKIRVSFSEDFDDDIGDFNIQSSSRPHLKSPPPPLLSQDSLSSSPPLVDPIEPEVHPQSLLPAAEMSLEKAERSDGEDGDEEAHHAAPNATHEQVGKMIESAEETLAEIDRDLDFFNTSHSLASPNLNNPPPLALPPEPHQMTDVRSPQVHPVLNVSCDPLADATPGMTSNSKNHGQRANVDSERPLVKMAASPAFTDPLHTHARNLSSTSFGSIKGAEYTEEWQDDDIVEMAAQSGLDAPSLDSLRKKIVPDSSILHAIADDGDDGVGSEEEDDPDPDTESESGDLEWERRKLLHTQDDTPVKTPPRPGIEPTITPETSTDGGHARWKRVSVSGSQFDIDMQAIEPFRNVLSHGGYYAEGLNAIIVFYGCHLPSRRREDYAYVMNHLFHYVIHTLEELVADDYVIIYFHGSTPKRQMPGLTWLKRCYQSIDRRLKKNLKGLFLVHPTLWLRTIVTMIRPFISSKFSSKLKFVRSLEELNSLVPMANVTIPEAITQLEELMKQNPHYLEEQEEEERRQMKEEERAEKRKEKERKKQEKDRKKQEDSERKQNAKLEKEKKKQEKEREKERKKEEQKSKAKK